MRITHKSKEVEEERMEGYKPKIPVIAAQVDICARCEQKVFFNERVKSTGKVYHKSCFNCFNCKKTMTVGTECPASDDQLYCKPCYQKNFGPKGFSSVVSNTGITPSHGGTFVSPKDIIREAALPVLNNQVNDTKFKFESAKAKLNDVSSAVAAVDDEANKAALEELRRKTEEMEKLMGGASETENPGAVDSETVVEIPEVGDSLTSVENSEQEVPAGVTENE